MWRLRGRLVCKGSSGVQKHSGPLRGRDVACHTPSPPPRQHRAKAVGAVQSVLVCAAGAGDRRRAKTRRLSAGFPERPWHQRVPTRSPSRRGRCRSKVDRPCSLGFSLSGHLVLHGGRDPEGPQKAWTRGCPNPGPGCRAAAVRCLAVPVPGGPGWQGESWAAVMGRAFLHWPSPPLRVGRQAGRS